MNFGHTPWLKQHIHNHTGCWRLNCPKMIPALLFSCILSIISFIIFYFNVCKFKNYPDELGKAVRFCSVNSGEKKAWNVKCNLKRKWLRVKGVLFYKWINWLISKRCADLPGSFPVMSTESSNSQMFPWLWGSSSNVTAEKTAGRQTKGQK